MNQRSRVLWSFASFLQKRTFLYLGLSSGLFMRQLPDCCDGTDEAGGVYEDRSDDPLGGG
jgi:hypothetical protein